MTDSRGICRLCTGSKQEGDLVSNLNDVEDDKESLGDYVNFYCHVNLRTDQSLPQKICRFCRVYIESFISFCESLKEAEKNNVLSNEVKINNSKADPLVVPKKEEIVAEERALKFAEWKKNSIENVIALFKNDLKKSLFDLDAYSHVTVPHEHVTSNGEISPAWLDDYDLIKWSNFEYHCKSCNKKFDSFISILKHFQETSCKFKLSCSLECDRMFANFNAYVNHAANFHKNSHLAFTCFVCNKLMYNIASLIIHVFENHQSVNFFYPCIECGYYSNSLTSLRLHFLSHDTQEVSDSDDDDPTFTPHTCSTPKVKRMRRETLRETFPCETCDRVLLTRAGLIYHQKTVCAKFLKGESR